MGWSRKIILQEAYAKSVRYNGILMYSIHNESKPVIAERFMKNLKAKIYKKSDRVRINKYQNIFSKGYAKNCSREIFVIDFCVKI